MNLLARIKEKIERAYIQRLLKKRNFDVEYMNKLGITADEIINIKRYVEHLQKGLNKDNIWNNEISQGGIIGTRYIIHEAVEIRALRELGINLTQVSPKKAREILHANAAYAHKKALSAEIKYLQNYNPKMKIREIVSLLEKENDLNNEGERGFLDDIIIEYQKKE